MQEFIRLQPGGDTRRVLFVRLGFNFQLMDKILGRFFHGSGDIWIVN